MQQLPACRDRHATTPFRKYFRVSSLLLAFSLFGMLFAACGGGSSPAAGQQVTLNVMVSAQPLGGEQWWKDLVKHFEAANPNITVKLNYQPNLATANTFVQTAIQTGTPLDVATVQEATTTTLMAKNGLAPLDGYLKSDPNLHTSDLNPALLAEATQGGHIYGIPFDTEPEGRRYNKDLFAKAGVQPPTSYKDLLPVCQALQKVGVAHPLYEDFGGYPAIGDWTSWDAFPLSADGQQATIYPKMMVWATARHDLIWKYHCVDAQFDQAGKGMDPKVAYANGQLAWQTAAVGSILQASPTVQAFSAYTQPEAGPAGVAITIGGSHLVIPAPSKNKDAAWKFISFEMSSKADQKAIALQLGYLPAMVSLATDPDILKQKPYLAVYLKALTMHTVAAPNVQWYYEISYGVLHTELLNAMRDPDPSHIAGYLQKAQAGAEAQIKKDKQLS